MAQIEKEFKEDTKSCNRKAVGNPFEVAVMCFDCMIAKGYKRNKGCHTATIKHCTGCDTAKPIIPKRHWSKQTHKNS